MLRDLKDSMFFDEHQSYKATNQSVIPEGGAAGGLNVAIKQTLRISSMVH
jgi:hypothetical protein